MILHQELHLQRKAEESNSSVAPHSSSLCPLFSQCRGTPLVGPPLVGPPLVSPPLVGSPLVSRPLVGPLGAGASRHCTPWLSRGCARSACAWARKWGAGSTRSTWGREKRGNGGKEEKEKEGGGREGGRRSKERNKDRRGEEKGEGRESREQQGEGMDAC